MHAVRLRRSGAALENQELPDPEPGPAEVLIDIRAAGICHSDAHYRADSRRANPPITLGHEIAGIVTAIGEEVTTVLPGDRVAVHYLLSCGSCDGCARGEQFCIRGAMIGKDRDGGYAEAIVVPERNVVAVPREVPLEDAAIMMCSTATAYHALRLASLRRGESVAILGFGGLGVSALQLARDLGAREIFAVDIVADKLAAAADLGAIPIAASNLSDLKDRIDVALDFAGHPATSTTALRCLTPGGRLMVVAVDLESLLFDPYRDLLAKERRIIGCSDHLRAELDELMDIARRGDIDLSSAITRTVPLDATAIDAVLDELEEGTSHLRTVITRNSE